jgi:tetratricopeptide (TPR) repeat protein
MDVLFGHDRGFQPEDFMNDPITPLGAADLTSKSAAALDTILTNSHPLMVEAFSLAAIPKWYNVDLLEAIRNQDDGREDGLFTRLCRYSFVSSLRQKSEASPACFVRAEERSLLQKRWIAEDPQAYKAAHQRALTFWETHPDPNPFAHTQNCLYHQFFVDYDASVRDLIVLFRTYANDHQFAAIARLLAAAEEACAYLALLDSALAAGIDDLFAYLKARLAQLRGQWAQSCELLNGLKLSPAPGLSPYIARAYGYAFAQVGNYVEAIEKFREALVLFDQQGSAFVDSQGRQSDRAYTLIALGERVRQVK